MKVLFEICHPAHVHYFRNLITGLKKNGHQTLILAQKRGIIGELLKKYNHHFKSFPNLPKSMLGKLLYIPFIDFLFYKEARKFKPDILVGFAGAYISHVGILLRKPSIVLDDTDGAKLSHLAYKNFASAILTPDCFLKDFGKKHIKFSSFMELSYLHPKYLDFNLNHKLFTDRKSVFIRFVSWRASHDIGQKGIDYKFKLNMIEKLSKDYNILISSEDELPEAIKNYKIQISPENIHSLLSSVDLYIGEGATMASECAMLGIPAIYVNTLTAGTLIEQEKYGLIFIHTDSKGVIEKAVSILETHDLRSIFQNRSRLMLSEKIDTTKFILWFIENYPASFNLMKQNPSYQVNFK